MRNEFPQNQDANAVDIVICATECFEEDEPSGENCYTVPPNHVIADVKINTKKDND